MVIVKTKAELIEKLRKQITEKDSQAIKALMRIYEYQTTDEKNIGETVHNNGVGFTGCDSKVLTYFAKAYSRYGRLTDQQLKSLKVRIGKYATQLVEQSISKGLIKKQDNRKGYIYG